MKDKKRNFYLYEAIELRNEYDRHVELLQGLLGDPIKKRGFFSDNDDEKEASADFDQKEIEKRLKTLQTKRVKLNQEIQKANFESEVEFGGKKIKI